MEMTYIPLTEQMIQDHNDHLYILLTVMRNQMDFEQFWFETEYSKGYVRLNTNYQCSRDKTGIHRNNFNPAAKSFPLEYYFNDEYICLMPFETWDLFNEFLSEFPARSRNAWVKLFCYIYYNADWRTRGFYNSIENIAADTGIKHSDVCKKLITLEQRGFILRGSYAPYELVRTYTIPDKLKSFRQKIKK